MRLGTDIIEIERIRNALDRQENFSSKILSPDELLVFESLSHHRKAEFLAGRFAAKEAYVKALETGIGKIRFTDITILPKKNGAPNVVLAPIVKDVIVSISHSKDYATATVIIDCSDDEIQIRLAEFLSK